MVHRDWKSGQYSLLVWKTTDSVSVTPHNEKTRRNVAPSLTHLDIYISFRIPRPVTFTIVEVCRHLSKQVEIAQHLHKVAHCLGWTPASIHFLWGASKDLHDRITGVKLQQQWKNYKDYWSAHRKLIMYGILWHLAALQHLVWARKHSESNLGLNCI